MLIQLRIRLTSPALGNQQSEGMVRRFRRHKDGHLATDFMQWSWTLKEAVQALHLTDIDHTAVRPAPSYAAPTLVLHVRKYRQHGKLKEEMFESIRERTVLTLLAFVPEELEDKNSSKRTPTLSEFQHIMEFVGRYIGLSPWGSKYGYGRFEVLNVSERAQAAGDSVRTPETEPAVPPLKD